MSKLAGLTAQRFAGKPLRQPDYSMRDVPKCTKDLSGSKIQEVDNRDDFNDSMAEMVLLCNEVMRRKALNAEASKNKKVKRTAKPLSLEYMADRLDVDDPIFGFFVRTDMTRSNSILTQSYEANGLKSELVENKDSKIKEGMLQGFVTVTTFTSWQKTFRWDSMHDSAFSYDEPDIAADMYIGKRKSDADGSLAAEMQNTVRCGDPWNEGIVWPRIAEISLLGGIGSGKVMLSLVIEELERMPPSANQNYDYLVLQATDNSIPFYESMGFVRVGAITENPNFERKQTTEGNEAGTESDNDTISTKVNTESEMSSEMKTESEKPDAVKVKSEIVSGPIVTFTTTKNGETPSSIAKKLNVDVWDIIFLNQYVYPEMGPRSWLKKNTHLFCPDPTKYDGISNAVHNQNSSIKSIATQWYFSLNNETPKGIATKFKVKCRDLVLTNKERISDLQASSRLMPRTRLQVSNLDSHHDRYVPYCHWTFPDDDFESSEPSYMMVRKLDRKSGKAAKLRPVRSSLSIQVTKYIPKETLSDPPSPTIQASVALTSSTPAKAPSKTPKKMSKKRKRHPDEPIPPKRPMPAYFFYLNDEREKIKKINPKVSMTELTKVASSAWKVLPVENKAKYEEMNKKSKINYMEASKIYKEELEEFKKKYPDWMAKDNEVGDEMSGAVKKTKSDEKTKHFFNKVVKLNSDGKREAGDEFQYYYVLTYLPDLFWCHLAPMRKVGFWGADKPKAEGRPIWMLVNEDEGKELDITASACEIVKAKSMRGCPDADEEQWDIIESGSSLVFSDKKIMQFSNSVRENGKLSFKSGDVNKTLAPLFTNRANDGFEKCDFKPIQNKNKTIQLNSEEVKSDQIKKLDERIALHSPFKLLKQPLKNVNANSEQPTNINRDDHIFEVPAFVSYDGTRVADI